MHISYLSTVEKMLALPVERLVNTSSSHSVKRLSLSPESHSNSSSTCGGSPDSSESKVMNISNPSCNCKNTPPISPPYSEPEVEVEEESNNNLLRTRIKIEEEEDNNRTSSSPAVINNGKEVNEIQVNHRAPGDHRGSQACEEIEEEDVDVGVDNDTDVEMSLKKSQEGFRPFVGLNLSMNSSATSNNAKNLKFSIDDILRPDFGLSKFQLLAQSSHHHHQKKKVSCLSSPRGIMKGGSSSVSSSDGHRPYRPSSVLCHSEDSNGSCTSKGSSRRGLEVVDDTKVNPPVPEGPLLWPAWVYCTRYSDRPSSGPRSRRIRKSPREIPEEKRPRTAFTAEQLARLKREFDENRYLTERRRQDLARELKLHENQIKIWFQNKRAKLKKSTGTKNGLAQQLMAQGLYNHSTVPVDEDDEMMMGMM